MVRSPCAIRAWQDSREVASSPQALSSRSSSFSSAGASVPKPSRRITWQVVQAQDFSQACSMSMWFSSSASQIDLPLGASNSAPCGHSCACGSTLSLGIRNSAAASEVEAGDPLARERALHAGVHAAPGELLGGAIQRLARLADRTVVVPGGGGGERRGLPLDRGALLRG